MADVATPTVPEDLTALSDDELASLLGDLEAAFDELHDNGPRDSDTVAALTELADGIDAVKTESTKREGEAQAVEDDFAALNDRVHGEASNDDPEPDDGDGDDGDGDGAGVDEGADDRVPVTAAAAPRRQPDLRGVARRTARPRIEHTRQPTVAITAAADLPGVSPGAALDVAGVLQGMHDRARVLNDHSGRVPVARINVAGPHVLSTVPAENQAIIAAAMGDTSAEALVAAGGWCAPSIPLFQFFRVGDAGGLLSLPTLTQTRGGVMVPTFTEYDFEDAFWVWTEEDDEGAIAEPPTGLGTKPCIRIPCPTWVECRPAAYGLCILQGNMMDRAWPELTRDFLSEAMNAYLHWLSGVQLAAITKTAVAYGGENSDAAGDLLSAVELAAAGLRSRYKASPSRTITVLMPDWTYAVVRANLAKRAGVDLLNVTDGQIANWFTTRGIAPQFLTDYQPLRTAAAVTNWPASIKFTAMFAGSVALVDGGTIDLGVQRDSTLNATNDFTAAWMERFQCVIQLGPTAEEWTVDLTVDGVTACCAAA